MICPNCGATFIGKETVCYRCGGIITEEDYKRFNELERLKEQDLDNAEETEYDVDNSFSENDGFNDSVVNNNNYGNVPFGYPNMNSFASELNGDEMSETVSVKEWLLSMLICCIPLVNIIMMFVWAFSDDTKKSKSNFFKATLIWSAVCIVIGFLISAFGFSLIARYVAG